MQNKKTVTLEGYGFFTKYQSKSAAMFLLPHHLKEPVLTGLILDIDEFVADLGDHVDDSLTQLRMSQQFNHLLTLMLFYIVRSTPETHRKYTATSARL